MSKTIDPSDPRSVTNLRKRLFLAVIGVVAIVFIYANIYRWAVLTLTEQDHSLLKATQVVIEALTTAGFGGDTDLWREHDELAALVIVMNLTGVLLVFLAIPLFAVPLFRKAFDSIPPRKTDLEDHVVICGHSAIDDVLRKELDDLGTEHLFIEEDLEEAKKLDEEGINTIYGDAERTETLHNANLETARALVADIDDETNTTAILSANRINPDAKIVSVVQNRKAVPHHEYAGAHEVVVSKESLGQSLAGRSIKTVSEQVDEAVDSGSEITFEEYLVDIDSDLVGQTIEEADLFGRFGMTVVGGWFGARFRISPPPDTEIVENTILLVTGSEGGLEDVGLRQLPRHRGHPSRVVVCGYGEVGRAVAESLKFEGVDVTVVDARPLDGVDVVGDITDEQTLQDAGVDNARSIVFAVDDDATAIYSAILMNQLAPDVEIISRANDPENVWKLYNAGADYVLSLPAVTGEELASVLAGGETILTPRHDFEFVRSEAPALIGQTIREADIRNRTGCTVIGIERNGELITNVDPEQTIEAGDVLIAAGGETGTEKFRSFVTNGDGAAMEYSTTEIS